MIVVTTGSGTTVTTPAGAANTVYGQNSGNGIVIAQSSDTINAGAGNLTVYATGGATVLGGDDIGESLDQNGVIDAVLRLVERCPLLDGASCRLDLQRVRRLLDMRRSEQSFDLGNGVVNRFAHGRDTVVNVGQGRQGRRLGVVLAELVDSLLGTLDQARNALPALAYYAFLIPGKLVAHKAGNDQRDLSVLDKVFERREQQRQPVILG